DVVTDLLKHAPDLPVATFDQGDFVPGIGRILDDADPGRGGAHTLALVGCDGEATPQSFDGLIAGFAADFDHVSLGHVGGSLHQLVRERAIVGHEHETFTGVVEPADGIHPTAHAANKTHDRGPFFGIYTLVHNA